MADGKFRLDKRRLSHKNEKNDHVTHHPRGSLYFSTKIQVLRAQQTLNRPVPYWIIAAAAVFTPSQGIFNFGTFIFPRFFAARAHAPQAGVWKWLRDAL